MKMKKIAMGVIVGLLCLTVAATASASMAQFLGTWTNTNPKTGGLTKLIITNPGGQVMVHAWGQCHPTDCDWGNMPGFAYGPNVSAKLDAQAQAIAVVHKESFAERLIIIRYEKEPHLLVSTYTRFTDKSGRTNYVDTEHFARVPAGDPLAQCMAANQRAHAEVHQMYQRAKAAGKINPAEAQAFAAMEGRLHALGQQLARGGWTLAECQQFSKQIAAERATLQRMAGLDAADPLAQCMAANQRAHAEVHQMYQRAKAAGKINPAEAQAFAAMEARLHALGQQLARGGWTLAECRLFSSQIAQERAALLRMIGTPDPLANCMAANWKAHTEVVQMYERARAAGKIKPAEALAFAAMEARLQALVMQLSQGGMTLAECQQLGQRIAQERAALQKMVLN